VTDVCGNTVDKVKSIILPELSIPTEERISKNISLHPNPAENQLIVSVENTQLKQLVVTDLNGKILFQQQASGINVQLNVSELSPGIYLVEITTENGTAIKRFVKE
jgi:hypothetical protein